MDELDSTSSKLRNVKANLAAHQASACSSTTHQFHSKNRGSSAQDDFQTALGMKMVRHASINEIGLSYAKVMKEDGYLEYFHTSKGEKLSDAIEKNNNVKEAFTTLCRTCFPSHFTAAQHKSILSSYFHVSLRHSFEAALERLSTQCAHWSKAEKDLNVSDIVPEGMSVCSSCNLTLREYVEGRGGSARSKATSKRAFRDSHLKYCEQYKSSCDARGLPYKRLWTSDDCLVDGCTKQGRSKYLHMCATHHAMPIVA